MTGRADIPIVLCCAEDDEPPLAKVVDQLHREGMAPELVTGVDVDVATFSASVDEARGPALFVICQSASLDRATARRLTGLFSARRGAGQRIVTVTFQAGRPLAILPAIRVAYQQALLAAGEVLDEIDARGGAHLRDVVESLTEPPPPLGTPAPVAVPPAANSHGRDDKSGPHDASGADAERLARELAEGLAEAEAILARRDASPKPRPRARPSPIQDIVESAPPRAEPGRPPVRLPDLAAARAGAGASTPPPMNLAAALDAVVPSHSGVMRATVETDPDTSRLPRRAEPVEPPRVVRVTDEPGGNRWLLAAAGLGVAVIVALALLQIVQPKDDQVARERSPLPAGAEPTHAAAPASAGVQPTHERTLPVGEPPRTTTASDPTASPTTASDPTDGGPSPTPDAKVAVETPVEPPPKTKSSPSLPPAPPLTSKRDAETAALEQAARDGKLDVVGKLFVVRAGSETTTWPEAAAHCRGKVVAGHGGFRLPSRAELRRLRGAKILGGASYWSRDKGEAGDEAFTVDGSSGNEVVYLLEEPNGATICVRTK
ncbi:MAG TPA: hypothetical protein VFG69_10820 [Nannocystaceae bacterium]|nr:hypothetical protein [Nannocystaceae bacterium]